MAVYHSAEESLRTANLLEQRREEMTKVMSEWEQVSGQIEANAYRGRITAASPRRETSSGITGPSTPPITPAVCR